MIRIVAPALILNFIFQVHFASAQPSSVSNLQDLINLAIERSPDMKASRAEVEEQKAYARAISRSQYVPKADLNFAYQDIRFDRRIADPAGNQILNAGANKVWSLTLGFDLMKILSADSKLAKSNAAYSTLHHKLVHLELIRNIKKTFALVKELEGEVRVSESLLQRFSKLNGVLKRESGVGVFNEIERRQFTLQQNILENDLLSKKADLDQAYSNLSTLIGLDFSQTRNSVQKISENVPLKFSSREKLQQVPAYENSLAFRMLKKDQELSAMEADEFVVAPLPLLYVKGSADNPTYPSSDGPSAVIEAGVSFPLDAVLTRSAQKTALQSKATRLKEQGSKAVLEYRNQLRLVVANYERFSAQTESLVLVREEAAKLLDKAFLFFSQKRIDAMGTLDIFQKYLGSERNLLLNQFQVQVLDAELEYLTETQ